MQYENHPVPSPSFLNAFVSSLWSPTQDIIFLDRMTISRKDIYRFHVEIVAVQPSTSQRSLTSCHAATHISALPWIPLQSSSASLTSSSEDLLVAGCVTTIISINIEADIWSDVISTYLSSDHDRGPTSDRASGSRPDRDRASKRKGHS